MQRTQLGRGNPEPTEQSTIGIMLIKPQRSKQTKTPMNSKYEERFLSSECFQNDYTLKGVTFELIPNGMVARRQSILPARIRLLQLGWECWMIRR